MAMAKRPHVPAYPLVFQKKIKSAFSKMLDVTYDFNVVIQFWAPCEGLLLTTCDQPFVCSTVTNPGVNLFEKYRLNSLKYRYNIDVNKFEVERGPPMIINGPPATAFLNHLPEVAMDYTSVHQLSPLLRYAFEECKFTSYFMLPVFDTSQSSSCAGVVECCMETDGLGLVLPMMKLALHNAGLSTFRVQECPGYKLVKKIALLPKGKASHAKEDVASSKTTMPANTIILPSQQTTKKMIKEVALFNLCSSLSVEKPPVQTAGEY
ncbi:hypothetical protein Tco_1267848 [Tanacetum coccineum]